MLPKRRRLSAAEVRNIITAGRSGRAGFLSVKHIPSTQQLRAAVVVSKKVARGAVERNRLRRAVYRALVPFLSTGDVVIFVQKVPTAPLAPIFREELMVLLKKNG
ncbi:MAG: ribonuclease P protein component [Candidatus Adlerbacteria bacterium]|nr:ribonuclease P protein component [Candidatus Adlerbacteria bacterium]